jgi:CHAT domain-containing protein
MASALVVLSVYSVIAISKVRGQRAPELLRWNQIAAQTTEWLKSEDYPSLLAKEITVLDTSPCPDCTESFIRAALNCARGRMQAQNGDPYRLLLTAERTALANRSVISAKLALETAQLMSDLHCYRRAMRLLDLVPTEKRSPEHRQFEQLLKEVFRILRTTAGEYAYSPGSSKSSLLNDQLEDLLGAIPENSYYDEMGLAKSALEGKDFEKHLIDDDDKSKKLISGLLLTTRTVLQVDSAQKTKPDEDHRPGGAQADDPDLVLQPTRLVELKLSAAGKVAMAKLVANGSTDDDAEALAATAGLKVTAFNDHTYDMVDDPRTGRLESTLHIGNTVVLIYQGESETSWVFFALGNTPDSVRVFYMPQIGYPSYDTRDVTGDGSPEFIAYGRNGSGGYLNAAVVDVSIPRIIWTTQMLPKGQITFANIDGDSELEILATSKTALGRNDCGVCPARYEVTIYDYDKQKGTYVEVADRLSSSELEISVHGDFNLGPQMILSAQGMLRRGIGARTTPEAQAGATLATLKAWRTWSDDRAAEVASQFEEIHNQMTTALAFRTDAEIQSRLVAALDRPDLPSTWQTLRRIALFWQASDLFLSGDYTQAFSVADQSWILNGTEPASFRLDFGNMYGLLCIESGKLSCAYDSFVKAQSEALKPVPQILGNLSWYHRIIHDYPTAYRFGAQALDAAIEQGSGDIAVDMLHIASAASFMQHDEEALDWLGRAVRIARGSAGGGHAAMATQLAADIALKHDEPGVAIRLLDEELTTIDQPTWNSEDASLMLEYAHAASALGQGRRPDESVYTRLLEAAAKNGEGTDASVQGSALYDLSRYHFDHNDLKLAYGFAREAFEAITTGRRNIGNEKHKFSFLADKKVIASWLFERAIQAKVSPEEMLKLLESWKMQAFLDMHNSNVDVKAKSAQLPDEVQEISQSLQDGDLLLDYSIGKATSFVVSHSRTAGTALFPVSLGNTEVLRISKTIAEAMNVQSATSLFMIRRNWISLGLKHSLRQLHDALIGKVTIPPGTRRLIIGLDEPLYGIPWTALQSSTGRYLIDDYEVILTPSALLRVWTKKTNVPYQKPFENALAVAALGGVETNEIVEPSSAMLPQRLAPLPSGLREIDSMQRCLNLPASHILLDSATQSSRGIQSGTNLANPVNFLMRAPKASVIHVVAHGIFDAADPMRSTLFFDRGDGGQRYLRASDLASMDLHQVSLVTLASCQTAMNNVMPGAEPIGFLRALLGAGVAGVILAGWEVDDRATADLFSSFYCMLSDKRQSTALRASAIAIRTQRPHPYFWAGVNLYGYGN